MQATMTHMYLCSAAQLNLNNVHTHNLACNFYYQVGTYSIKLTLVHVAEKNKNGEDYITRK